jgi:hypothetical protein
MGKKEKIALIHEAALNFVIADPPPRLPLVNEEVAAWLARHDIAFHVTWSDDGRASGFNKKGTAAIRGLAVALFAEQPSLRIGTRMTALGSTLAKAIRSLPPRQSDPSGASIELDMVEDAVANWFKAETIQRKFLVPCTIIPDHASTFSVGPVQFFSLQEFAAREGVKQELFDLKYGLLVQTMRDRAATWLAEVAVLGFDESVGGERANLSVDVALVAIQLSLPLFYSKEISRITGRTMPPAIGTVFTANEHIHTGISRREPGLGINGGVFDQQMALHTPTIESIGRRVAAYVRGAQSLPKLEQAWSDAAFWLHEGLAEPISTVAVAKLETSIEVLFSAESSKGSTARFHAAFKSFYGLESSDPMRTGDPQTAKQFIKSITGARSRILHGTWSTLAPDMSMDEQGGRGVIEMLAIDLVRRYTFALDLYTKDPSAVDEVKSFLEWIDKQRSKS